MNWVKMVENKTSKEFADLNNSDTLATSSESIKGKAERRICLEEEAARPTEKEAVKGGRFQMEDSRRLTPQGIKF